MQGPCLPPSMSELLPTTWEQEAGQEMEEADQEKQETKQEVKDEDAEENNRWDKEGEDDR